MMSAPTSHVCSVAARLANSHFFFMLKRTIAALANTLAMLQRLLHYLRFFPDSMAAPATRAYPS